MLSRGGVNCCCRMLNEVIQRTFHALADPSPLVQNAALFAIGQFAEHFQVCVLG